MSCSRCRSGHGKCQLGRAGCPPHTSPARTWGPGNQEVEVADTCSHSLPQAVATLYVAVFFCCTVMYTYWVSRRGCRRYHWVYNCVCYDCEERLTWCYEGVWDGRYRTGISGQYTTINLSTSAIIRGGGFGIHQIATSCTMMIRALHWSRTARPLSSPSSTTWNVFLLPMTYSVVAVTLTMWQRMLLSQNRRTP